MDADIDTSRLKRDVYEMPADVQAALVEHQLMGAYRRRPAYQQNDYIGWITRTKLPATRGQERGVRSRALAACFRKICPVTSRIWQTTQSVTASAFTASPPRGRRAG